MGYSITKQGDSIQAYVLEFILDEPDEIKDLPNYAAAGSSAFVISTSQVYMKNTKGEWKEV